MKLRERLDDEREQQNSPGQSTAGGQLGQLRHEGEQFLRAAEEAINRALSTDSEAFLTATRQQGGQ